MRGATSNKKEVDATRSRPKGKALAVPESRRLGLASKLLVILPLSPDPELPSASAPIFGLVNVPIAPLASGKIGGRAPPIDENDFILLSHLVPSPEWPPLKRLRIIDDPKVRSRSAPSTSLIPPIRKGRKGKESEGLRSCLEAIPTKARSGVISAVMKMYKLTDELDQVYLDQMEEVGVASLEKEAWEEKKEEIQTDRLKLYRLFGH